MSRRKVKIVWLTIWNQPCELEVEEKDAQAEAERVKELPDVIIGSVKIELWK